LSGILVLSQQNNQEDIMGNRAVIVFQDSCLDHVFSAAVYVHNLGYRVPALIDQLSVLMRGRPDDTSYAAARLIGIICALSPDENTGVGVFNLPADFDGSPEDCNQLSQGDQGVFLVNARTYTFVQSRN
jgi:hypothetical protein